MEIKSSLKKTTFNGNSSWEQNVRNTEAEIELARERVGDILLALRHKAIETADWRQWVRRRPGLVLGVVFVVGLWLGHRRT